MAIEIQIQIHQAQTFGSRCFDMTDKVSCFWCGKVWIRGMATYISVILSVPPKIESLVLPWKTGYYDHCSMECAGKTKGLIEDLNKNTDWRKIDREED